MPMYLNASQLLDFAMFFMGLLCAWAVIKGLSDD